MKPEILAAGPIVKEPGMLARRLVLRVFRDADGRPTEFVVHVQCFGEEGVVSYCHGSYFPCRSSGIWTMTAYEEALKKFVARMLEKDIGLDFASVFGQVAWEAREGLRSPKST